MKQTRPSITVASAAEYLGCTTSYTHRLYRAGKIEGKKLGDRQGIRLFTDSVIEFDENRYCE